MIAFIDLRTVATKHGETDRVVSLAYTDKDPERAHLLGNLEHCTYFDRSELVRFARKILQAFEPEGSTIDRSSRASKLSRSIAKGESMSARYDRAFELAENWINGNRSDVKAELGSYKDPIVACDLALAVYRILHDHSELTAIDFETAIAHVAGDRFWIPERKRREREGEV